MNKFRGPRETDNEVAATVKQLLSVNFVSRESQEGGQREHMKSLANDESSLN